MSEHTILVVEDNPANMMLTKAVLQRAGYLVRCAGDAAEARRLIDEEMPALVLMDISLPDIDGLALTAELRRQPRTSSLPIVALTAHAMADDEARALAAGCTGYITKPIDTRSLADQVAGYIHDAPPVDRPL